MKLQFTGVAWKSMTCANPDSGGGQRTVCWGPHTVYVGHTSIRGRGVTMRGLPLVGEEFAGYRLRAVLGRGGMSTVFRAENPPLGNLIALKVLAAELAYDDVFRARFLEESRIAAGLNHPNVVPI